MSRRTHKKSKHGCSNCKRRHIKCDESRPDCVNCVTAQLRCSFITQGDDDLEVRFRTTQASSWETQTTLPVFPSQFQANSHHFDLLCHFCTELWKDFQPGPVAIDASFRTVQKYIYTAPYLMHEILAISALHLSKVRHEKCDSYRHSAEGLQYQALMLFNHQTPELNQVNCVPMFLFSSFLGLHLLCDTIVHRSGDLASFLDNFVRYLRLHRGVRAITWGNWDFLRASELQEVISPANAIPNSGNTPGIECQDLINLINQPHIDPATMSIYQSAVGLLQSLFNVNRERPADSKHTAFAWPIMIHTEYTTLLEQRRPEALVILAYFAVLLHRHRDVWVFSDGGEFLIRSITRSLGEAWWSWLSWPNLELGRPSVEA